MNKKLVALVTALLMSVSVPAFAAGDSYEPNNSMDEAKTIYPHYFAAKATISEPNDVDYFKFKPNANANMTLKLTPPSDLDLEVYVFNNLEARYETRQIANVKSTVKGQAITVDFPVTKGVEYSLIVHSPTSSSTENYTISASKYEKTLDAAYEDNNTAETAAYYDFYTGSALIASIDSPNDVDYYELWSEGNETVTLNMINPGGRDYNFIVYDYKTNTTVAHGDNTGGTSESETFQTQYAGRYYVIVYGKSDAHMSKVPYQLFLSR